MQHKLHTEYFDAKCDKSKMTKATWSYMHKPATFLQQALCGQFFS